MKKRITLLMCALLAFSTAAFAQIKVSGTVTDASDGAGVPFASVVVKGTTTGVAADADGKYAISVPNAKSVLVFSAVGYENQEVTVGGRAQINVALSTDAAALDEVMVVAYGSATKTSFTGSAGKVAGEKIELVPNTNPLNTLNGTTPGLRLTSAGGQPGADATITVRGIGSLNGNTDPLIVMDGMIYSGNLATIPASDIESITVLKDAASTALYGSRAANGVIMITTKQGKGETPSINVKISHGFVTREQKDYKTMNLKDYMENYWQQLYNTNVLNGAAADAAATAASGSLLTNLGYREDYYPFTGAAFNNVVGTDGKFNPSAKFLYEDDVDWLGATERVGQVQDYGISASGKGKYTTYFGSVGYTDTKGYMVGTGFERYSARANVSFEKKWLKFGVNASGSVSDQSGNLSTSANDRQNAYHVVLKIVPTYPIHLHWADGSYVLDGVGNKIYDFGEGYNQPDDFTKGLKVYYKPDGVSYDVIPARTDFSFNVAAYTANRYSHYKRNIVNVKPFIEIKLPFDLKFTANASIYNSGYTAHSATPYFEDYKGHSSSVTLTFSNTQTRTANQLLSWTKSFGDHHVDALVGHEFYMYTYDYETSGKANQIVIGTNYQFNNYADANTVPSGYQTNYRTESYLGRVNYDYLSKYYLSASFRRDGSSRFYSKSRWGNFWSVGGSWIVSNEEFMKGVPNLDQLKVRASIGTVGNDDLGAYWPYMALIDPFSMRYWPVTTPLWFLLSLFWVNVMFYLLQQWIKPWWGILLAVVAISVVGYMLGARRVYLPFMFDSAMVAMPYFILGWGVKRLGALQPSRWDKWGLLVLLVVALPIYYMSEFMNLHFMILPPYWKLYFVPFVAILALFWACKSLPHIPVFCHFGRYSLIILGTHPLFFLPLRSLCMLRFGMEPGIQLTIIVFVLTMILEWPVIWLLKTYAPRFTAQQPFFKPGWKI